MDRKWRRREKNRAREMLRRSKMREQKEFLESLEAWLKTNRPDVYDEFLQQYNGTIEPITEEREASNAVKFIAEPTAEERDVSDALKFISEFDFGVEQDGTDREVDELIQSNQEPPNEYEQLVNELIQGNPELPAPDEYEQLIDELIQSNQELDSYIDSYIDFDYDYI